MSTITNQVAYLRTSREFPADLYQISVESNKAYVDVAQCMNERIISLFPTTRPALNGENWLLSGNARQQCLRQVYQFTAAGNIAHGINLSNMNLTLGSSR